MVQVFCWSTIKVLDLYILQYFAFIGDAPRASNEIELADYAPHNAKMLPRDIVLVCAGVETGFFWFQGGIKAVVWTDVFQAFLIFTGLIAVVVLVRFELHYQLHKYQGPYIDIGSLLIQVRIPIKLLVQVPVQLLKNVEY